MAPEFLAHQIGISVVFTHVRYFYTVTAIGKDKKKHETNSRTSAARRPRAARTSIRDVILTLKLRHDDASQRIQDFLDVFFMAFPILKEVFSGEQERESIIRIV